MPLEMTRENYQNDRIYERDNIAAKQLDKKR